MVVVLFLEEDGCVAEEEEDGGVAGVEVAVFLNDGI